MNEITDQLYAALKVAYAHLEWIGYVNSWEWGVARRNKLGEQIMAALKAYEEATK